jgi:hypothetical protein
MQVPLDAAQPRGRVVDGDGPALLKGTDPLGRRTRAEQAPDEPAVDVRDAVQEGATTESPLPVPFGPRKPVTRPGRTVNDRSSTASLSP